MKHEVTTQMTRQLLASSLRRHLEKKELSRITVSEIVEDCGVNRKTFYYHFENIQALFKWMLEQETVEVIRKFDLLIDYREAIQFVMDYVRQNRHIVNSAYDAMGREGLKRFLYDDLIGIFKTYVDSIAEQQGIDAQEDYKRFLCEFFTEAIASIVLSRCSDTGDSGDSMEKTLLYMEHMLHVAVPALLKLPVTGEEEK